MNTLTLGTQSVTIATPRSRPGGLTPALQQAAGRYSDGRTVVYDKNPQARYRHRLRFNRLTDSELAALVQFYRTTTDGIYRTFTWSDGVNDRTVRFSERSLFYEQLAPGRHQAEFILEESA